MTWTIEYFEQKDTTQHAEIFEDELDRTYPKLRGKLLKIIDSLVVKGNQLGGGYIEPCHDYKGLWEMRAIYAKTLAREFFGFDGERILLLRGYVKPSGKPASDRDLKKAFDYWEDYQKTQLVSPVQEERANE